MNELHSVVFLSKKYESSCSMGGTWADIEPHSGKSSFGFEVADWPEIQAVINAAIAGFDSAQTQEKTTDD